MPPPPRDSRACDCLFLAAITDLRSHHSHDGNTHAYAWTLSFARKFGRRVSAPLCPLHISRSDAPIGLRYSRIAEVIRDETIRRRVGTPFTLAQWPMARNVSIRVGWYEEVVQYCTTPWWYGKRVIFITTLSCVVHVRLPIGRRRWAILNMFNIAR